jgi:hypothetical protein
MRQPIVYVDTSAIREDKLEQVEVAIKNLAAFVEADMPPQTPPSMSRQIRSSPEIRVLPHPHNKKPHGLRRSRAVLARVNCRALCAVLSYITEL